MNCDNLLCIYQSNERCILKNISIDSLGICTECIQVNLEDKQLEKAKRDLLTKLHGVSYDTKTKTNDRY